MDLSSGYHQIREGLGNLAILSHFCVEVSATLVKKGGVPDYIINLEGPLADSKKIAAIKNWPLPRGFLALTVTGC